MLYSIRHVTRFTYDDPIRESVMEVRMRPLDDAGQRCVQFALSTTPSARILFYQDSDGNTVHHFGIPGRHTTLEVTAEAVVERMSVASVPERLEASAWAELDAVAESGSAWEGLTPSAFARPTPLLLELAKELAVDRREDPLSLLRRVMAGMFSGFEYRPKSTTVDSPIDDALKARKGVCQDFAHIFIALARSAGIPCRYVSGYLFHQPGRPDRSTEGATHAWAEAWLPGLGWVGFDPTNDVLADGRHIRVATGRDYADVPPTRGVFKGVTAVKSELSVTVEVVSAVASRPQDSRAFVPWMSHEQSATDDPADVRHQHQRQQQQ